MAKRKDKRAWDAQTVKALRRTLGLTQQQLAEEMGTRQQTISEWETGLYTPRGASASMLNIIAERAAFPYQGQGVALDPHQGSALEPQREQEGDGAGIEQAQKDG